MIVKSHVKNSKHGIRFNLLQPILSKVSFLKNQSFLTEVFLLT